MNIGKLQKTEISTEMKKAYLDYAMSVIVSRALPDVRDGLKPVHRRILFAMHEMNLTHQAKYSKSAKIVGEVMGKYHPHGDMPIYDALVRLAQDFSMRYPLIDGQGNYGCFTKDTKIKLTDGRSLSFKQLIKEQKEGVKHWTFSFNSLKKKIEVAEVKNPRLTRKNAPLVEVELDNGEKIRCTPDHRFMLLNGKYKHAEDLKAGDSLMPLYTKINTEKNDLNLIGYEQVLQPKDNIWQFVHRLADELNLANKVYPKSNGRIRHHKDFNKLNNNPDNIQRLQWEDHWRIHYELASWRHEHDPIYVKKLSEGRKKFIEENRETISLRTTKRNKRMWKSSTYRAKQIERIKSKWQDAAYKEFMRQASSENLQNKWKNQAFRESVSKQKSNEMKLRWQNKKYRAVMQEKMREFSLKLWQDPNHKKYISELMKLKSQDPAWKSEQSKITKTLWNTPEYRSKFPKDHFRNMAQILWSNPATQKLHREKMLKQQKDPSFIKKAREAVIAANKKRMQEQPDFMKSLTLKAKEALHKKWNDPKYKKQVIRSRTLKYASSVFTKHKKLTPEIYEKERKDNWVPKLENALHYFNNFSELETMAQTHNHKVVNVRALSYKEDTYDLTINPWHNFVLAAGVFVHNSVDGDPAAAMRYTECRLAAITSEMLTDLDKETVTYTPNFDATLKEPVFLPAKLPNLLLMGSEGIAVGMATKIPPHNLGEVIDAIIFMIAKTKSDKGTLTSNVAVDELLEFIKGPDFPTAGAIYDATEIRNVYETGRGKIVIRGKAEIEDVGQGKSAIIITELPYQVNKALLVARIAELAKDKKIEGISDLRDESDRHGTRIMVELKRDAVPKKVLNNLFKHTTLQTTFPANIVALVDGTPQTLNLKAILEEYLKHRYRIVTKRSEFELKQAKARLHILEGLKIAVDHIDAVIKTIRESKDQDAAKQNLMEKFKLSELQAVAILDMQLRRLAALERQKIEDELLMVKETITYLEDLLSHPEKILSVIKEELTHLKDKYIDQRRTRVFKGKVGEFSDEDLIQNEPTVITITNTGYIKRQSLNSFRTQHRGGKGIKGMTTKDEDGIFQIRYAQTHDNILFFTNKGKVYQLRAFEIAESSRTSKGTAVVNLINVEQGERVESFINYHTGKQAVDQKGKYIFLSTKKGTVKKTSLAEFENIRRNGIAAIKLEAGDELAWSKLTDGAQDVILTTHDGKAIRFSEKSVRPMGRSTMGVRGIKLQKEDMVIGMDVIGKSEKLDLLTIMENGLGKKTSVALFRGQSRGGQGSKVAKVTLKTGKVVFAQVTPVNCKEFIMTSKRGLVVKLEIASVPRLARATQGVILMRFSNAIDRVTSATCIEEN